MMADPRPDMSVDNTPSAPFKVGLISIISSHISIDSFYPNLFEIYAIISLRGFRE